MAVNRRAANAACPWLLLPFESLADAEDMSVRMADVHLADAPRLVGRRPGDLQPLLHTVLVDFVDILDPDRHPHAFVLRLGIPARRREYALSPASLSVQTEKDLAIAGADAAERRRLAPVPPFLPAEALKPGEALLNVGNVQDRGHSFRDH